LVAAVVGGLKRAPEEAGLAEEDEEERSVALMLGLERVMTEPPDSGREYGGGGGGGGGRCTETVGCKIEYDVVHLQTSLLQLFALLSSSTNN
jgi:hypothetical protein